jgi:hypothetical protein
MLNIVLNLQTLVEGEEAVDRRLKETFSDFIRNEEEEEEDEFPGDWESGARDQCIRNYDELLETLARMLIGKGGTVMQRWRSFHFIFPWSEAFIDALWPFKAHAAPSLQELELHMLEEDIPLSFKTAPSLSSLLELSLSGWMTLDRVSDCPNLLDLDISDPKRWKGIDRLAQFSSLQTIRICAENVHGACPLVPDLHFPQLRSLFLTTVTPVQLLQAFKPKILHQFILEEVERSLYGHGAAIPDAHVFSVTQVMMYLTEDTRMSTDQVEILSEISNKPVKRQDDASYSKAWKGTLISLFSQLKSAHTIGTSQMLLDLAVKTTKACQNDGGLPSLRSIVEVDEWEHICQPPYASFSLYDTA